LKPGDWVTGRDLFASPVVGDFVFSSRSDIEIPEEYH